MQSGEKPSLEVLEQCKQYLEKDDKSLANCGEALGISPTTFLHKLREAFRQGYITLRSPQARREIHVWLEDYWRKKLPFRASVAAGRPDDFSFAEYAAETLLSDALHPILTDNSKTEVTLGVVSGSSTGLVVEHLAQSRLWDEKMSQAEIRGKSINIVSLNVTPVVGWELEGNANIAVCRLAVFLRDRLPDCKVVPFGLSTQLVVPEKERKPVDTTASTLKVVQLSDPGRLDGMDGQPSRLDLVITGVGVPQASVFQTVLTDEKITPPSDMVGDVAYAPVNKAGEALTLTRERPMTDSGRERRSKQRESDREECFIYSAIRLKTMQDLVGRGARIVLIARNTRRGEEVDKTDAITAAITGRYVNYLITDEPTALRLAPGKPSEPK